MPEAIAIVTGTSRGIGEALALSLLEKGFRVFGIARSNSLVEKLISHERFISISYDLSQTDGIARIMEELFNEINYSNTTEILLINNAAMLEPLKSIDQCDEAEMALHLHINLLAPMVLISSFIRHTQKWEIRKRIVNVTSGLAEYSAPSMSLYASSKAALNILSRCVADEQRQLSHPVEVVSVDPGMADTAMQTTARSQAADVFPMLTFFKSSYEDGKLWSAEEVAIKLLNRIEPIHLDGKLLRLYED
ncbi:short-chain dehydrogenase [Paenibacillus baekrokdamisoli]|uniref:Short-chain dehydrogenase n=1 Tax=Paenibacillus baekrokdamisoli TaxID=1712516 RepID=A0A3G9J5D2_9BACL|nr:SDR family NAD(P)-dependent oxidoreductase [Paenibacillus baekrokdamisoli]MBB3070632.1 benzil reductase ((S)-benzoin forming) [Paenibacillus baekrokdamisoli]BBH19983.1 short-chain dehydrogenase [Paenibacillus baekrokdamisoli]